MLGNGQYCFACCAKLLFRLGDGHGAGDDSPQRYCCHDYAHVMNAPYSHPPRCLLSTCSELVETLQSICFKSRLGLCGLGHQGR